MSKNFDHSDPYEKYEPTEPFSRNSISLQRYAGRIKVDHEYSGLSQAVANKLKISSRKTENPRTKSDRANRATNEQVLDPRTRMILFKMINRNLIFEVNGCISTGKEANVYHSITENGEDLAIKIYKTSILIFKDRDRYVTGEFRFRHGYNRHNPRKMVKMWAEKEMRNLKRLIVAKIPCPMPIELRSHVLVMSFIGSEGIPAPRLKDANFSPSIAYDLYFQSAMILRKMYHECKLVHADFSEYNLLCKDSVIYVIDVSQSVEHDHPQALYFLRKDCANLTEFFKRNSVNPMTLQEIFDFVTDVELKRPAEYLLSMKETLKGRTWKFYESIQHEESVFRDSFIPRTLNEVIDIERDIEKINEGDTADILYRKLTGNMLEEGCSDESEMDSNDDLEGDVFKDDKSLSLEEMRLLKKENKKKVKEENRERRKTKMSKYEKKKKTKSAKK